MTRNEQVFHSFDFALAQLRHAHVNLRAGAVHDQRQFAFGLIGPQIVELEKIRAELGGVSADRDRLDGVAMGTVKRIERAMSELVDLMAASPAETRAVDPRAWDQLLIYHAPVRK